MKNAWLTLFSALIAILQIIVWNILIYMIVENFRSHENYSWQYLGLVAIGCIAVSGINRNLSSLLPEAEPTEDQKK